MRDYVDRKIAAIAAHRTQYPIAPDMLPLAMLQDMMGHEYFVRVAPDPGRLAQACALATVSAPA